MDTLFKGGASRRRVKRRLRKKIAEWIASVDDESLRATLRKHTIVTGGSIASMLLGEQVKDYDVYMRNIDATEAVANYYATKVAENKKWDMNDIRVVRDTRTNIKGEEEERVINFIRSDGIKEDPGADRDMEDTDHPEMEVEESGKYRPVFISENAITLSDSVQIVTRFYGEPDEIHRNYDFIHACNYYDFKDDELVLKADALEALLAKRLHYVGSLYPIASLFRMRKFINRGWKINAGEILKIAWQISLLDLTDLDVLREQLTGVDMAYFISLVDALETMDHDELMNISAEYVARIIDRIFNE